MDLHAWNGALDRALDVATTETASLVVLGVLVLLAVAVLLLVTRVLVKLVVVGLIVVVGVAVYSQRAELAECPRPARAHSSATSWRSATRR
jgi:succinate dehydrogenase hydrophobic anchor subunit